MPWKDSLLASVQYRSTETTKDILESGVHPNGPFPNMVTPLQIALDNNDKISVHLLLKFNADVNIPTSTEGRSLLHQSANREVSMTIFKMILKANADTYFRDSCGRTALHVAAESLDFRKLGIMLNCPNPPVNVTDVNGETPMHTLLASSTKEEHIPMIKKLFKYMLFSGFDVNIYDNNGRSIFHVATQHLYSTRLLPVLFEVFQEIDR